jgi:hypothetical protein
MFTNMISAHKINILAYQEGNAWVAQGVEHDIYARSNSLPNLLEAFGRALAANMSVNAELGRTGLDGIKPAPAHILSAFSESKMTVTTPKHPVIAGVQIEQLKITDAM